MTITARAPSVPWALAGLLACSSLGCAGEQEPLIVLRAVRPDDECIYDPNSEALAAGLYDVSSGSGYVLGPVLRNNLLTRTTEGSNTGVEDGELRLEHRADIRVHLPSEVRDRLPPDVSVEFEVTVATNSLPPDSESAIPISLLSQDLVEALDDAIAPVGYAEASIDIVFHATRAGNSRNDLGVIDAREYTFPLQLCYGCLLETCECDETGECGPGMVTYAGVCGRAQDPLEDFSLSCSNDETDTDASAGAQASTGANVSTGPQEGSSGSSGT